MSADLVKSTIPVSVRCSIRALAFAAEGDLAPTTLTLSARALARLADVPGVPLGEVQALARTISSHGLAELEATRYSSTRQRTINMVRLSALRVAEGRAFVVPGPARTGAACTICGAVVVLTSCPECRTVGCKDCISDEGCVRCATRSEALCEALGKIRAASGG